MDKKIVHECDADSSQICECYLHCMHQNRITNDLDQNCLFSNYEILSQIKFLSK